MFWYWNTNFLLIEYYWSSAKRGKLYSYWRRFESAVVFYRLGTCFVLPDAHSRSNFNCRTTQLFGSCLLTIRQLSFDFSAVVFWQFGSQILIFRLLFFAGQLFFDFLAVVFWSFGNCFWLVRQLFFDRLAIVFFCFGSCFLPVRQLFCFARRTQ